jgi:minor histocompatibility antigen H13
MTVAKGFDSPMKILILNKGEGFSMIGIGDIIIPGLLVSLCLRIDFIRNLIIVSL